METWRRGILVPKVSGTSCAAAVEASVRRRASVGRERGTIARFPEGALREVEEPVEVVGKLQKWIRVEVSPSDEWGGGGGGVVGFPLLDNLSLPLSLYVSLLVTECRTPPVTD